MRSQEIQFFLLGLTCCLASSCLAAGKTGTKAPQSWSLWTPTLTPQIALAEKATDNERDAAAELAKYIAQASGKKPEIVAEATARKTVTIYLGNTVYAKSRPGTKWPTETRLLEETYRIASNATAKTLTIEAGGPMALKYAVADFARIYGGARWYIPTDLFQVIPRRKELKLPSFERLETPTFAPRTFSYVERGPQISYSGEQDPEFKHDRWALRNRLSVDGRLHYGFNHNLYRVIVPSRDYDAHPEWFPLINGKRLRPQSDDFQFWQPELTDPAVVEKFIQAGRDLFNNSSRWWEWYSLSINDGYGWSESEEAKKINGEPRYFRGRLVESNVYYNFVNKVASALYKEFPNRQIGLVAYYAVEAPPTNIAKLPPNVNVVITQEAAQHFDPVYAKQDRDLVKDWLRVANGNVYRYEYSTLGWTVPRYYPTLLAQDAREMKKLGLKGYFTEDGPQWANNTGPLLWLSTQLWWNPEQDEKKLIKQFCDDLFGPASPAMQDYFAVWERVWMRQKSGSFFAGLYNVPQQLAIYTAQDRLDMEKFMTQAQRLATSGIEKQRIEFFAKGWTLINYYLHESELSNRMGSGQGRAKMDAALKLLTLLDEDEAWKKGFRKESALLNGSFLWNEEIAPKRGSWPDVMRARAVSTLLPAITEEANGDPQKITSLLGEVKTLLAKTSSAEVAPLLEDWLAVPAPANAVVNPTFQKGGQNSATLQVGEPDNWIHWVSARGGMSFQEDRARMTGADQGVVIQEIAVKGGETVLAKVRYRARPGAAAPMTLSCRWVNEKGWFPFPGTGKEGMHDLIVTGAPASEWQDISVLGRVPEGATGVKLMFGASGQGDNDWMEFTQPYFGHHSGK